MNKKTIASIKKKVECNLTMAKYKKEEGNEEMATWYEGIAEGLMEALYTACAISKDEYLEYAKAAK